MTTLTAAHVLSWSVNMSQRDSRAIWCRFSILARVQKLYGGINRAVIFLVDVGKIGRSSISQQWRSGNGFSWMVANVRAQCLRRLNI